MRFLIHGINYAPELTGIGKYTSEMAEWLTSRGQEVRVVTAPPYYPEWKVGEGYDGRRYRRERRAGVEIWRCPLWVPAAPSGLKRLIHLASFALSSLLVMLVQIAWRPQVTLVVEPPFFCAPIALLTAKLSGGTSWLHIQDFEIDAAFELGMLPRRGGVDRFVSGVETWLMRRFDRVSSISASMVQKLYDKRVAPERILLFPNWVDTDLIRPDDAAGKAFRQRAGISLEAVVVLYSGNMGEKQGLEILIEAARRLEEDPSVIFLICGDGGAKSRLVRMAEGLPNIRFFPLQPLEHLNELLNAADLHALPQRADVADLVMPSKLTGILSCGGAVVATANTGTELATVIDQTGGRLCAPGDVEGFTAAISALARDPEGRRAMGEKARAYALAHLGRDATLERMLQEVHAADGRLGTIT